MEKMVKLEFERSIEITKSGLFKVKVRAVINSKERGKFVSKKIGKAHGLTKAEATQKAINNLLRKE